MNICIQGESGTEGWRKLHSEKYHNRYVSPNITRINKEKIMS